MTAMFDVGDACYALRWVQERLVHLENALLTVDKMYTECEALCMELDKLRMILVNFEKAPWMTAKVYMEFGKLCMEIDKLAMAAHSTLAVLARKQSFKAKNVVGTSCATTVRDAVLSQEPSMMPLLHVTLSSVLNAKKLLMISELAEIATLSISIDDIAVMTADTSNLQTSGGSKEHAVEVALRKLLAGAWNHLFWCDGFENVTFANDKLKPFLLENPLPGLDLSHTILALTCLQKLENEIESNKLRSNKQLGPCISGKEFSNNSYMRSGMSIKFGTIFSMPPWHGCSDRDRYKRNGSTDPCHADASRTSEMQRLGYIDQSISSYHHRALIWNRKEYVLCLVPIIVGNAEGIFTWVREVCKTILAMPKSTYQPESPKPDFFGSVTKDTLLEYAAASWIWHCKQASQPSNALNERMGRLIMKQALIGCTRPTDDSLEDRKAAIWTQALRASIDFCKIAQLQVLEKAFTELAEISRSSSFDYVSSHPWFDASWIEEACASPAEPLTRTAAMHTYEDGARTRSAESVHRRSVAVAASSPVRLERKARYLHIAFKVTKSLIREPGRKARATRSATLRSHEWLRPTRNGKHGLVGARHSTKRGRS